MLTDRSIIEFRGEKMNQQSRLKVVYESGGNPRGLDSIKAKTNKQNRRKQSMVSNTTDRKSKMKIKKLSLT